MCIINAGPWSSQKAMTRPTISVVNVTSFAYTGRTFLKRDMLECERRFFNNKTEIIFAKQNCEFCVNLTNRERALLVLEKRMCWSRSVFADVNDWMDCKN